MSEQEKTIGVIGFGIMGTSMAKNLAKKGYTVRGYSRTHSKVEASRNCGVIPSSLEELASCPTILLSVSDGPTVESILFGSEQTSAKSLCAQLSPGTLIIDTTTTSPREAESFFERCKERGLDFVDCPVTGGDIGAQNGTLTCMCGGAPSAVKRAEQVLRCIGSKIVHIGESGSGQRMKAVNQIAVALGIVAMTEALVFSLNQGIKPEVALEILQGGAAGSWALSNYAPRILRGEFGPGFSAEHMLKDLRIALSEVQAPLTLEATEAATKKFEALVAQHSGLGNHALIKTFDTEL
jgi:3-hydroxyisobutyrate dehydrogenase